MSLNSSIQHLGTGAAALIAGLIVSEDKTTGKLLHYQWVGYLSVAVLLIAFFLGRFLFKHSDGRQSQRTLKTG